eukprot:6181486-Pleurochrysis_carterae.AAC.1
MGGDRCVATDTEVGLQIFQLVATQIEDNVARVDGRIELLEQVGSSHNESGAAMAAGPTHPVELKLHLAESKERVGGNKRA